MCLRIKQGYKHPEKAFKNWNNQTLYHFAVFAGDTDALTRVQRYGMEAPKTSGNDSSFMAKTVKRKPLYKASDKDDNGLSPFVIAVILGKLDCVKVMMDFDPDVVNITLYSLTAMHIAACANRLELVHYFHETLRVPVDIKDQNSATPIFYAAFQGHAAMVEYLLNAGCFVDLEDSQSQSPIMMALEGEHGKIARILLNHKADVNAYNLRGDNAIWLCVAKNLPKILVDLVGKCDLSAPLERHRNTLLHKLTLFIEDEQMGSMMIGALLSHGAQVDALNVEKKTPLFLAAALSKPKIVTMLLSSGANPKAVDVFDNTPLHFAFLPTVAEALVEKGAKVNAVNQDGMTPMHVMSAFGLTETVSCLRALGGKENIKNKNGNTPEQIFNFVAPPSWKVCLPFYADDEASLATGGIIIEDKPTVENAAQFSGAKNNARKTMNSIGKKLKQAGKAMGDAIENSSTPQTKK